MKDCCLHFDFRFMKQYESLQSALSEKHESIFKYFSFFLSFRSMIFALLFGFIAETTAMKNLSSCGYTVGHCNLQTYISIVVWWGKNWRNYMLSNEKWWPGRVQNNLGQGSLSVGAKIGKVPPQTKRQGAQSSGLECAWCASKPRPDSQIRTYVHWFEESITNDPKQKLG